MPSFPFYVFAVWEDCVFCLATPDLRFFHVLQNQASHITQVYKKDPHLPRTKYIHMKKNIKKLVTIITVLKGCFYDETVFHI